MLYQGATEMGQVGIQIPTPFKSRTSAEPVWAFDEEKVGRRMPSFAGTQLDIADVVRGKDMRRYLATLTFIGCALLASRAGAASSAKEIAASPTAVLDEAHARVP